MLFSLKGSVGFIQAVVYFRHLIKVRIIIIWKVDYI